MKTQYLVIIPHYLIINHQCLSYLARYSTKMTRLHVGMRAMHNLWPELKSVELRCTSILNSVRKYSCFQFFGLELCSWIYGFWVKILDVKFHIILFIHIILFGIEKSFCFESLSYFRVDMSMVFQSLWLTLCWVWRIGKKDKTMPLCRSIWKMCAL